MCASDAPTQSEDWAVFLDNMAEEGKVLLREEEAGPWNGFSSQFGSDELDASRKILDELREDR